MSGETNRAAVPSVSHKLGSGRSHGTLLGRSKGKDGEGGKQLFSVFLLLPPQQLACVFPRSVIFSASVISFCHAFFFLEKTLLVAVPAFIC